jgi:hypothetical protein
MNSHTFSLPTFTAEYSLTSAERKFQQGQRRIWAQDGVRLANSCTGGGHRCDCGTRECYAGSAGCHCLPTTMRMT